MSNPPDPKIKSMLRDPDPNTMLGAARQVGRDEGIHMGRTQGRVEGIQTGLVLAVTRVLEARGVNLTIEVRQRIARCPDVGTLERWLDRSLVVASAEAIFDRR